MKKIFINFGLILLTSNSIILTNTSCSKKNIELAALGDSLTASSKYDYYVGKELHLRGTGNYGIWGSTISNIPNKHPFIYRYKKIKHSAKIIAVDGGYNDCLNFNVPIGTIDDNVDNTFYGALNILCDGLQQNYPHANIFFITPFYYYDDRLPKLTPYVNAIRTICNKYSLDCMDIFNTSFDFNIERDTYDDVHPTKAFSKNIWAPAIADFIREHYINKSINKII